MFDLDAAKKELAQSKTPQGFTATYMAQSGDVQDAAIAQVLQNAVKPLGITITIENVDPATARDRQGQLDYQITHSSWTMDIADPDELVSFAVDPTTGAKSFYTGYNNPEVVAATKAAQRAFDEKVARRYTFIQEQAAKDAFMAFLYYSPYQYSVSNKVTVSRSTPRATTTSKTSPWASETDLARLTTMAYLVYIGRRLVQLIPVLFGITLVVFFLIHLIPGDPASTLLGTRSTPQAVRSCAASSAWTSRCTGSTRSSWAASSPPTSGRPSSTRAPSLFGVRADRGHAVAAGGQCAVRAGDQHPAASLAASRQNAVRDQVVRIVPLVGLGMPAVWVGLMLQLVLALGSAGFPVSGSVTPWPSTCSRSCCPRSRWPPRSPRSWCAACARASGRAGERVHPHRAAPRGSAGRGCWCATRCATPRCRR